MSRRTVNLIIVAASALLCSMSVAAEVLCSWNNPGANPTTGSVDAAVSLFKLKDGLALAAKIKSGEYTEIVTVLKNDTRLMDMTSGGVHGSTLCEGKIDTSKWYTGHEEQGRVYRVNGDWLVWFWKCKNLSRWLPPPAKAEVEELIPTTDPTSFLKAADPIQVSVIQVPVKPSAPEEDIPEHGGSLNRFNVHPEYRIADPIFDPIDPGPVSSVDETSTLLLLLGGAGLLFVKIKKGVLVS